MAQESSRLAGEEPNEERDTLRCSNEPVQPAVQYEIHEKTFRLTVLYALWRFDARLGCRGDVR